MVDLVRDYLRALALHCLCRAGDSTAGELLESMGTTALDAGHPRQHLPATTAAVGAMLRELHSDRLIVRRDNVHNPRSGRAEARWGVPEADACPPLPPPPGVGVPADGAAVRRSGLSSAQLLGFLQIEFDELLTRMDREHQAAQQRARAEFEALRDRVRRMIGVSEAGP